MANYDPATYGDSFADVYDSWYGDITNTDETVAGISRLANGHDVLELGVGTGRLALPLAGTGLRVVGIDASASMLAKLAAKPGAHRVETICADMAHLPLTERQFGVVFAAFNTFFNLTSSHDQQRCLEAVAQLVQPGGVLAIEGFVPPTEGLSDGGISVRDITPTTAVLSVSMVEHETQVIRGHHIEISAAGNRMRPWMLHYRTPAQLDESAKAAGFTLRERWSDWTGTPFGEDADTHISIYQLDPAS